MDHDSLGRMHFRTSSFFSSGMTRKRHDRIPQQDSTTDDTVITISYEQYKNKEYRMKDC